MLHMNKMAEYIKQIGTVMVVIVWKLDLQLPVVSVPITLKFKPCSWWGVLYTTLCDKVCKWLVTGWWFSPGTPVFSTNKTDYHDITETNQINIILMPP